MNTPRKCLVGIDMIKNEIIVNGDVHPQSLADVLRLVIEDLESNTKNDQRVINVRHVPDLFRRP